MRRFIRTIIFAFHIVNTPKYVIDNFFNGRKGSLKNLWEAIEKLENLSWNDVKSNKDNVLKLINLANNEILKLTVLK